MSRDSKLWVLAALALVCAQVAASLILHGFALVATSDLSQLLLLISGTLALVPMVRTGRGRARIFWALMTLGVGFWCLYQALWCYYEVFRRQDVPRLYVGDVVLFIHLVPMIAALAMQPHAQQDQRNTRLGSLDFAMLLIWWLYLYLVTLIPWHYVYPDPTVYEHNLNVIYLMEKLALLGGLAALCMRSRGYWRIVYANWFGCTLLYGLSSYFANWAIERNVYFSGSLYDVPLAASMAWVTWIGLSAWRGEPEQEVADQPAEHGVWAARLGMVAVFSLPLFAAWAAFDSSAPEKLRTFRLTMTLCTMLILGGVVFLKQHILDRELLTTLKGSQESVESLRRLQAQLVQSEKLASLGQLVGGAAHELNNPLTALLGYSELLTGTSLSTEQRALVQKIDQQIRRTRTLVSSLLSFAKQVPGEKTAIDVNGLLLTAVKLYPPQLHGAFVQVHTDLGNNLPRVLGDSNQLLQVCLHVTNNAYHAMAEKGGTLEVVTRAKDDSVIIEFCDNGVGIEDPARVFDPFYTTRPVGQGAGLGLSVCYGIIQEHKGKILCQNRPEGGAIFQIELPAISARVAAQAKLAEAKSAGN